MQAYLRGVAHDQVQDVGHHHGALTARYDRVPGARTPPPPGSARIWVASSSGAGTQTLQWKPRSGRWSVVVMRTDAARGVTADVNVGVRLNVLLWIAIGLLAAGVLVAGASAGLLVFGTRSSKRSLRLPRPTTSVLRGASPRSSLTRTSTYPVDIRAKLDEPLSRWLWLVKWFLAIPHFVVLALLWLASWCSPWWRSSRSWSPAATRGGLFDLNVGILRWTWRVRYYATAAIGTDRYPPFTLDHTDYPADLDDRLPRAALARAGAGQVVAAGAAAPDRARACSAVERGSTWGSTTASSRPACSAILVLVAGLLLLFTGRYPATCSTCWSA